MREGLTMFQKSWHYCHTVAVVASHGNREVGMAGGERRSRTATLGVHPIAQRCLRPRPVRRAALSINQAPVLIGRGLLYSGNTCCGQQFQPTKFYGTADSGAAGGHRLGPLPLTNAIHPN